MPHERGDPARIHLCTKRRHQPTPFRDHLRDLFVGVRPLPLRIREARHLCAGRTRGPAAVTRNAMTRRARHAKKRSHSARLLFRGRPRRLTLAFALAGRRLA